MEVEPFDLQKHSFFGGLVDDQIETVVSLMRRETFDEGAVIIREGEQNDRIWFLLSGRAEVTQRGILLDVFEEGDAFGEMEVIDIMPAEATIKTLSPARIISLSNSGLHELSKRDLKAFSLLVMNLARDMSRRLRAMNRRYTARPEGQ
ncbi:MAG: cyclic nucleotide-binding domain-containing protein [Spirochaetaceae bacterium]|jgi:CRP-like cAMP-binding protein|nr:cyclic nucleotide-binding domain-containing protein [Spirochaetaceae bacterium]